MVLTLHAYTGQVAPLYIQSRGNHSGRPLREPIANCFAVHTDHPHAFAVAFAAYESGAYRHRIIGTCIPFLRAAEARNVLHTHLVAATPDRFPLLERIAQVDALHAVTLKRADTLAKLRRTLAASLTRPQLQQP